MSKLSEFQQFDSLSVEELFTIKGGCGSRGPVCEQKACKSLACTDSACVSNTCVSLACGSNACESCLCDSEAEVPVTPPDPSM